MATPIQFHFSCAAPALSALSSSHLSTTSHRSLSPCPCPCPCPTLLSSHSHSQLPLTHQHQQQHQKHQHQFIRLKPRSSASASASASKPQQQGQPNQQDEEDHEPHVNDPGVKLALSLLHFYKREISPLLPRSCRYVPTCSDYSILAFKKYGLPKGFILTACRICRCNPFGGYGFDPPRWFGEEREEPYSSDL